MNERGNKYALAALKARRSMISAEINQLDRQLRHRRDALIHVDATLRLLDPEVDIDAIPNKRITKRIKLFRQGELGRLILGALRKADGESISTYDVVSSVIADGGHGETARRTLAGRVRGNLAYLERRGKIVKIGERGLARWRSL